MIKTKTLVTMSVFALAASACQPAVAPATPAAAPISEADAAKIVDATVSTWGSMDAAKIKALYAPTVVGFDYSVPGLTTDRATWDKNQDAFAAAKFDKIEQKQVKIQVLDADTFVASGVFDGTSTAVPANKVTFQCTDAYEKDADGKWWIVTEQCAAPPKAA
ncbi:MAG: DUF4440 domain-containing protein [Croceibacterium sp.]